MLVRDVLRMTMYKEIIIKSENGTMLDRDKYTWDYDSYRVISYSYDALTQTLQIIVSDPPVDVIYIISENYRNTFEVSLKDYEADYDLIDHWDDRLEYRVTALPDTQKQIIDLLKEVQ